jgi:hypothetical protein
MEKVTVSAAAGVLIQSVSKSVLKQRRSNLNIVKIEEGRKLVITDGRRLFIIKIESDIAPDAYEIMSVLKRGKYMYDVILAPTDNQFPDYRSIITSMVPDTTNAQPVSLDDSLDPSFAAVRVFKALGVCVAHEFLFTAIKAGLDVYKAKQDNAVYFKSEAIEGVCLGMEVK